MLPASAVSGLQQDDATADLVLLQSVIADIELLTDLQRQAEAAGLHEDDAVLQLQAKVADCLEQLRWGGCRSRDGTCRLLAVH